MHQVISLLDHHHHRQQPRQKLLWLRRPPQQLNAQPLAANDTRHRWSLLLRLYRCAAASLSRFRLLFIIYLFCCTNYLENGALSWANTRRLPNAQTRSIFNAFYGKLCCCSECGVIRYGAMMGYANKRQMVISCKKSASIMDDDGVDDARSTTLIIRLPNTCNWKASTIKQTTIRLQWTCWLLRHRQKASTTSARPWLQTSHVRRFMRLLRVWCLSNSLFLYRLHQMHLRHPEPCYDAMRCSQSQLRDSPAGITAPQLRSIQKWFSVVAR